jgi:hypothetical protein
MVSNDVLSELILAIVPFLITVGADVVLLLVVSPVVVSHVALRAEMPTAIGADVGSEKAVAGVHVDVQVALLIELLTADCAGKLFGTIEVLLLEVADDLALSSLLLVTERTFLSFCAFL